MYDYLMLCQADKYHQQQLDAQQEYEDALGARFMKLAEKFSYMANHVPRYEYTSELLESIENMTDDLGEE
jgi:hypothetical protein